MAECNGCGRTIDDKYEYCPHCGTRRGDFLLMKYNSLSQKEDKRKKTIEIMGSVIDKRKNMEVVKPSRIEKQKLEIHSKELEDR